MSAISRRNLLATTPALAAVALTGAASAAVLEGPDPIFAAIDKHRAGAAAWKEACDASEEGLDDNTMYAFSDAEGAAAWAMLDVEPTSVAGVGALLTYVAAVSASGSCIITEYENEESLYGDALIRWAADNLERLAGGSNV